MIGGDAQFESISRKAEITTSESKLEEEKQTIEPTTGLPRGIPAFLRKMIISQEFDGFWTLNELVTCSIAFLMLGFPVPKLE